MSISVQGISKTFKGRKKGDPENVVLKDVSFDVQEGEFVSLLKELISSDEAIMSSLNELIGRMER